MELFKVGLALFIPWAAATLVIRALWQKIPVGGWWIALGYGYFLGLLSAILLLRIQVALGGRLDWRWATVLLALFGLACARYVYRRFGWRGTFCQPFQQSHPASTQLLEAALFAFLLAWLGWRCVTVAQELWLRPVYPWDAWGTWEVRARVWSELQQWIPFVEPGRWLAESAHTQLYTVHAWEYPYALSLMALWPTLAFGTWYEPVAHLPWLGGAIALGLGFYGQARLWGAPPLLALVCVWLLLSLPMLDTQIALAGYADVWLAAIFGLAVAALLQWARSGERWQCLLMLLLILTCPWIKREGVVWMFLFVPVLLMLWIPRRARLWLLPALTAVVMLWWWHGGIALRVPGWGEVALTTEAVQIPTLGRFMLAYHQVWEPVAKNLFVLANWHLLGYLTVLALLVSLRHASTEAWRVAGMLITVSILLVLFGLFFFTDAYIWAMQYTSFNRIVLQCAPALCFWIFAVLYTRTAQHVASANSSA